MDKLLEIVMAAVVISVTALAVLFALNGQSGDFTTFLGNQSDGAQCDLHWQEYKNALECPPPGAETTKSTEIRNKYRSECETPSRPFDANEVC